MSGGPERDVSAVRTVCPFCGVGCGVELLVEDGEAVNVERWDEHPVNGGQLCMKGVTCHEFLGHQDRLKHPMLKVQERFVEVSWEFALRAVVEELNRVRDAHGPESVGFLASAKCTNEENFLVQRLARRFGTGNVDQCARLCHSPSMSAMTEMLGSAAMSNGFDDMEEADAVLIAGANPAEQHPILARRLRRSGSTKVLVDPRKTRTAKQVDLHLRPRPGTDAVLFSTVAHVLLHEMEVHRRSGVREFIENRTRGFGEMLRSVESSSPEETADTTGVPPGSVREASHVYGEAESGAILLGLGVTQHLNGTDNVRSLIDLALCTGNFGRPGTGVNPLRGQDNVQGACDVGALPDTLPGYRPTEREGLTAVEMLKAAEDGELKALYVVGENPAVSEPDGCDVEAALGRLDLLVVQDLFPTQTARFADALLPAAAFAERSGTVTSAERRVQLRRGAVEPPGEAMADWRIVTRLARALDLDGFDFEGPGEVYREMASEVGFYPESYGDLPEGGTRWPTGLEGGYLFGDRFETEDGLACFVPVGTPGLEEGLVLTTGRVMEHYNTGEQSRRVGLLYGLVEAPFVEVSPADAESRGVSDGDVVRLSSNGCSVEAVTRVTDRVLVGTVFAPFHFVEGLVNRLVGDSVDPESGIPGFKRVPVEMERVDE
ncbi:MAG: Formate dehydrogenase subunit alpha [Methanonatronarchaeales archaeon]|nr:Formate dehydrogenase subunit alpha [Methanonatronarchaeales archaeon]